jgi:hypothetical protein
MGYCRVGWLNGMLGSQLRFAMIPRVCYQLLACSTCSSCNCLLNVIMSATSFLLSDHKDFVAIAFDRLCWGL